MATLTDKIAVVTGASSGIGKAIALSLAHEGAKVCIVGRRVQKLKAVIDCARQFCLNFMILEADLAIDEDIKSFTTRLLDRFKGIDILIHSAGIIAFGRIDQASIDDFDRQYKINVRAPYLLTQLLLPLLRNRSGQVIFLNSSAGLKAQAGVGQYAASKHALKAVADSLREEVNADGIRVMSVYPGRTASPMQESVHKWENRCYYPEHLMQPEDVASVVINALNLPRTAEVTDIHIRPLRNYKNGRN
jgi:NADP-dependent 3-hydroxy acid dehydrogenase YdfG